jgi:hypothetical protein
MAVKNIVDFHAVPTVNTSEIVINVPDSTTLVPLEERLFDPNTLVITTVTGGAGTTLVAGVDYSFSDLNEFATSKAGVDVYQTLNIINATYQGVDIFIQAGTLNQYGDNLLAEDVNDLQSQINSVGPFINANFSFDISASNQTLDLSSLSGEANGYRIKAKWSGGDGTYQLSITIPSGYTVGGVAKATIEADLKGDGQGVLVLVKNGTDLELEKFFDSLNVTYNPNTFPQIKYADGRYLQQGEYFSNSTTQATLYNFLSPILTNLGDVMEISGAAIVGAQLIVGLQFFRDSASTIQLRRHFTGSFDGVTLNASGTGTAGAIDEAAFSFQTLNTRWTTAQIEVS